MDLICKPKLPVCSVSDDVCYLLLTYHDKDPKENQKAATAREPQADEISQIINDFKIAARNAIKAGKCHLSISSSRACNSNISPHLDLFYDKFNQMKVTSPI